MKRFILFFALLIGISLCKAQIITIADESFESSLSGWTITPANYWMADTNLYAGGHTSYHGFVPIGNPGDTVILTSPLYDFGPYGYAFLSFNQICKVSGSDICQIEYRENTMSSTWQVIPRSSYKGSGIYTNAMFHEGSYVDWIPGDSLAIPTNNWWKTEHFDISNEVSFTEVQFRFKITRGSVLGTQFAYGWLIDNFKLTASVNPIAPPVVELISNYGDTVYNTGPFEIKAKVATRTYAPILIPKLYYSATYNYITTQDSIAMTAVEGDSIWTATIPQYQFGTSITFSIVGYDSVGNTNSANSGFYVKRGTGGIVNSIVYVGDTNSGSGNLGKWFHINALYSWSRNLFYASELGTSYIGGIIVKIAVYNKNYNIVAQRTNQKMYFMAVDSTALTYDTYIDPSTIGATLVWSGGITTQQYWNEVTLQTPFYLPPGKNLIMYFVDESNTTFGSSIYWTTHTTTQNTNAYGYGTSLSNTSHNVQTTRVIAYFGFGSVSNDSNSVALHSIDNPGNTVFVNPSAQIPVIVTIKNKGIADLDSCYIDWTVNGIPQVRHTWRGNLPDDFNATDTIGYFSPAANQYDTIVAWVSMPNGVYDSTSYDDTLIKITYGMSGLDMSFITLFGDTVYNTGPFSVQASIASRTMSPLPGIINLNVKYTYNGIDSYDTLPMTALGNNIYEAIIPQHVFGTNVEYSITLIDSLGNVCSISDGFYIKRPGVGTTGYVIIGNGTVTDYYTPASMYYRYSWARMLYLSNEFDILENGGLITKLAWYYDNATGINYTNQTCYFKAVDNTALVTGYIDPVTDGATQVWAGTLTIVQGWVEITLTTPFYLPPGKHLQVYWHHNHGAYLGSTYYWRHTSTSPVYRTVQAQSDNSFPSSNAGSLRYDRPNARFYIVSSPDDSNSVALHSIDNPTNTVFVNPSAPVPVAVTIKNKGISNLDSCYIDWTLNGVPQPRYTWKGNLPDDFNATDTIGYYSPAVNGRDTIVVWVSSPNGVYDSTTYDDTIIRISYGISGLDLAFVSSIDDTVYITGPFTVQASIASRTMSPLPGIINLNVKYTYNGIDSYDTLPMTALGNNIYEAIIPQHVFGTDVAYSITLIDSLGNICHIQNQYHIKHPGGNDDSNSVALFEINNPGEGSMVGNNPVIVTIKNKGIKHLDSCLIHWTLNGVLQTPYVYRGHLPEDFNATVTIGNYIQRSNRYDSLMIWVSMPNGEIDSVTNDDTLMIKPFGCYGPIAGDYIVGPGPGADVASLEEAFFIGSMCGVSGNVTLKLQSGTYNENWNFSNLSTIMGNYTLTITSENGNRNSVILKPTSGVGVVLNNTDNLIIKDICIDNTSSSSYGVQFTGTATNIELRNIYFKGDTVGTSSSTSPAPIYKASAAGVIDNIRIIGNIIEGGYYGIYFYGGNSSSAYGTHVVIDSNIIKNQYYYANYFYYTDFTSISHNTILSRVQNAHTYWYGIRFYYCNFNANGNRIHARTSFTYLYEIYVYYAGYYNATSPSVLSNNEIIGTTSSTYYGMYLGSSNTLNIYNNSIYLDATAGSRTIYISSSTTSSYDFKNNILINTSLSGYAIYFAGTTTPFTSDYNCLYSPGNIGYFGSAQATLLDWQNATTQDANSVSLSPSFVDVSTSLELSDYSPFVVKRLNSVTEDIRGDARTAYTSMGAYSVNIFSGYNLAMTAILSQDDFNDILCYNDYTNLQVVLKNEGTESYDFNVDSIRLTVEVSGATNFKTDTLINTGSLSVAQTDTFDITNVLPITASGIYYITTYLTSPVDTIHNNDTVHIAYPIHRIELPYDIDFSTSYVDFIQKQVVGNASWEVEVGTGNTPVIAPVFGTGRLTFHSENNPGSISQIIFNGIHLIGTYLPKLEFWYAHDNANPTKRDFISIKISTDGIHTELLDAVYRYEQSFTNPGWAYYSIDLSAYANEPCVSLIFEGNSFGGGNQNIDRIRLSSSPDISLTYLSPQLTDLVACNLNNISAKVILSNLTAQKVNFDLDTCNIYFQIRGMDSLNIVYPLHGILHGLEKDTIELSQNLDLSHNGIYDIVAYVNTIDDNTWNDTIKRSLLINPDLIIQDISGIDEVNCKQSGDSVYVSFKIVNMGNLYIHEFPLSLQINGVNVLTDTIYQQMEPGDYIQYAFAEPFVVPVVSDVQPYYFVKIQTELPCDAQPNNNIKEIMACVEVEKIIDVSILSIDQPLETPCEKGLYPAQVAITLSNQGNVDIEEATVYVEVDSAGTLHASFSETTEAIYARSILEYVFTETYNIPNIEGQYQVKVFVDFTEGDTNALNDTLIIHPCAIFNDVSINETSAFNWTMGQNIPNPASAITRIPYSIPQEGVIHFTLTTITGQVLHSQDIPSSAGSHSLEFDTQHLAGGIYYYSMEYQGQRIVKKMTVQR